MYVTLLSGALDVFDTDLDDDALLDHVRQCRAALPAQNLGAGVWSDGNGELFGYLLPLGTPGTVSTIPDRLAGWWLASVAATVAVLLLSPPSPGDRLRAAAARSARELAARLEASVRGAGPGTADRDAFQQARNELTRACSRGRRTGRPGWRRPTRGWPASSSNCSSGAPR